VRMTGEQQAIGDAEQRVVLGERIRRRHDLPL
jgi:hypothetical protein